MPGEVQAGLQALDLLTPGDFANVVRRIRTLQLELDPAGWLAELRAATSVDYAMYAVAGRELFDLAQSSQHGVSAV